MTKRELLLAICESPGYAPEDSSETERNLTALNAEGWVAHRLDGWVATSKALDEYPEFTSQLDIADPTAVEGQQDRTVLAASEQGRRVLLGLSGREVEIMDVPFEQTVVFVRALLQRLPMDDVALCAAMVRAALPSNDRGWRVAEEIARLLVRD